MTPELEKYYETYFNLFTTDGWKQFVQDVTESADVFNVRHVEDEGKLRFVQGQLAVMDKLINWEVSVKTTYDQVKQEEENEE
jgi:hypothetical protein